MVSCIEGINETEMNALASCFVEGNKTERYYRIQNYYFIGSECCLKGLWLLFVFTGFLASKLLKYQVF